MGEEARAGLLVADRAQHGSLDGAALEALRAPCGERAADQRLEQPSHTRLATIPGRPPNLVNPPPGCKFAPRCAYAQPRCLEEEPPLVPAADPTHEFRCWFPVGTPEGDDALARNRAAGQTATGNPV